MKSNMAKGNSSSSKTQCQRILTDLKAGRVKPCYVLMGEEPFYVDLIDKYIVNNLLTPDQQGFNQFVLYGNSATAAQVLDYAKRFPMMSERQVVVVREAQQMRDLDPFTAYFKHPNPSTVLVLCFRAKMVDKRTSFWKEAAKSCEVLESSPIREGETALWIIDYLADRKLQIDRTAAMLLSDFLGTDLGRIAMELDKLQLLLPQGEQTISVSMVEQSVGVNRDFSPFALTTYLSSRNFAKIQPIAQYFGENPKTYPLVMLISIMLPHFTRVLKYHAVRYEQPNLPASEMAAAVGVSPYFMREVESAARHYSFAQTVRIIRLLCQYDGRYKSSDRGEATDGELLMEMLCKMMA